MNKEVRIYQKHNLSDLSNTIIQVNQSVLIDNVGIFTLRKGTYTADGVNIIRADEMGSDYYYVKVLSAEGNNLTLQDLQSVVNNGSIAVLPSYDNNFIISWQDRRLQFGGEGFNVGQFNSSNNIALGINISPANDASMVGLSALINNVGSLISAWHDSGIVISSKAGLFVNEFRLFVNPDGTAFTIFTDTSLTPKGIQYEADYSTGYTDRSLVDKAYVDKSFFNLILKNHSEIFIDAGNVLGAKTLDITIANFYKATIIGNTQFTFTTNVGVNRVVYFTLEIINGGSYLITFPINTRWSGGSAPTLTDIGTDIIVFYSYDNGVTWVGYQTGEDVK